MVCYAHGLLDVLFRIIKDQEKEEKKQRFYLELLRKRLFLGIGPDRGQGSVEWRDFLSEGPRASQAGLRPSQSGLRDSQAGLRASQAGLRASQAGFRAS